MAPRSSAAATARPQTAAPEPSAAAKRAAAVTFVAEASAGEFPRMIYHKKTGVQKIVQDADEQATHEERGFGLTPPDLG